MDSYDTSKEQNLDIGISNLILPHCYKFFSDLNLSNYCMQKDISYSQHYS